MLGADVCRDVAAAHHVPRQIAAGEKVVLRAVTLAAAGEVAHSGQAHEKDYKYPVIKRIERKRGRGVRQVVLLKERCKRRISLAPVRCFLLKQFRDGLRYRA